MISKQDILDAVNKIKAAQTKPVNRELTNPERDWFMLITGVFVSVSILLVWAGLAFVNLQNEKSMAPAQVEKVPAYKKDLFTEIIEIKRAP